MKITLLSDEAIRLENTPGAFSVDSPSGDVLYSPFHMLAGAVATCTYSVLQAWATTAGLTLDDLTLEVHWKYGDNPHRVSNIGIIFDWASLPQERIDAAKRVVEHCTIHATLTHPPQIDVLHASEAAHVHSPEPTPPS
jgi:uncharacterized OsmC-like protein